MLFLLPLLCLADVIEDKENACFLVSDKGFKFRLEEFRKFTSENSVSKGSLFTKVLEDSFYHCLSVITEEETESILKTPEEISKYTHLIALNLEDYKEKKLENSKEFLEKIRDVRQRPFIKAQHRKDL